MDNKRLPPVRGLHALPPRFLPPLIVATSTDATDISASSAAEPASSRNEFWPLPPSSPQKASSSRRKYKAAENQEASTSLLPQLPTQEKHVFAGKALPKIISKTASEAVPLFLEGYHDAEAVKALLNARSLIVDIPLIAPEQGASKSEAEAMLDEAKKKAVETVAEICCDILSNPENNIQLKAHAYYLLGIAEENPELSRQYFANAIALNPSADLKKYVLARYAHRINHSTASSQETKQDFVTHLASLDDASIQERIEQDAVQFLHEIQVEENPVTEENLASEEVDPQEVKPETLFKVSLLREGMSGLDEDTQEKLKLANELLQLPNMSEREDSGAQRALSICKESIKHEKTNALAYYIAAQACVKLGYQYQASKHLHQAVSCSTADQLTLKRAAFSESYYYRMQTMPILNQQFRYGLTALAAGGLPDNLKCNTHDNLAYIMLSLGLKSTDDIKKETFQHLEAYYNLGGDWRNAYHYADYLNKGIGCEKDTDKAAAVLKSLPPKKVGDFSALIGRLPKELIKYLEP